MVGKFKIQIKKEGDKTCVKLQGAENRKLSECQNLLESNFKSNSF